MAYMAKRVILAVLGDSCMRSDIDLCMRNCRIGPESEESGVCVDDCWSLEVRMRVVCYWGRPELVPTAFNIVTRWEIRLLPCKHPSVLPTTPYDRRLTPLFAMDNDTLLLQKFKEGT